MNQFRKSFKIPLTFSSSVKLKLIPPSQVSNLVSRSIEFSELSKTNRLIIGTYKPPPLSDITVTSKFKNILSFYRLTHELMVDFNMALDNPNFNELIEDHELSAVISEPTCFKSINPTCSDNFLRPKKLVL